MFARVAHIFDLINHIVSFVLASSKIVEANLNV